MAALILLQVALGLWADKAAKPLSHTLLDNHVRVGLLIFALILLRLGWRISHPPPPLPPGVPPAHRRAADFTHRLLYALVLLLPVSGYVLWAWMGKHITWFGLFPISILFTGGDDETWRSIAGYTHEYAAYAIIALILIHVAAAMWHEFIARDRLISASML